MPFVTTSDQPGQFSPGRKRGGSEYFGGMAVPVDSHVHSEWSWDTTQGSMLGACERAVALGLPGLAFTEHLDHTVWTVEPGEIDPDSHVAALVDDGRLVPPRLDVAGYLECVDRCRYAFPGLRVMSGLEVGEPHWHADQVAGVLAAGEFDRVLGSLHCLPDRGGYAEPPALFARRDPREVLRTYLGELVALAEHGEDYEVVAHVDYPLRY